LTLSEQSKPWTLEEVAALPVKNRKLEEEAASWPNQAKALQITDQASYDHAAELVKAVKLLRKEAEEHHRPVISAAHNAHKVAIGALNKIDEPLAQAEAIIKAKVGAWDRDQERRRIEAERVAREEAERIAAEQLERDLEAAEAAGARPEEVTALIVEAERMPVVVPLPQPTYQPAAGISTRVTWAATVTNMSELLKYLAANPQYSSLVMVNQTALNALARAQQSGLRIPGVKVTRGTTVAVR
jgi:hypothetical protein